jgi:hypothetical protein
VNNDSVFSGLSAHSAREIADALGNMETTAECLPDLIGAVMSLARTVDQLERQARAVDGRLGPSVNVGAHALSSTTVDALRAERMKPRPLPGDKLAPADQLALVYAGLRELYQMLDDNRVREQYTDAHRVVLDAARWRIAAMLDAADDVPA